MAIITAVTESEYRKEGKNLGKGDFGEEMRKERKKLASSLMAGFPAVLELQEARRPFVSCPPQPTQLLGQRGTEEIFAHIDLWTGHDP